MENWRSFMAEHEHKANNIVYLFEGKKKTTHMDFDTLLENFDQGRVSEKALMRTLEKSLLYEVQLLNEQDIVKWLKLGYQKGAELAGKAKEMAMAAFDKVAALIVKTIKQAVALAKRALAYAKAGAQKIKGFVNTALNAAGSLLAKSQAWCEANPKLCLTLKILVATVALLCIAAACSSSAHAGQFTVEELEKSLSQSDSLRENDALMETLREAHGLTNESVSTCGKLALQMPDVAVDTELTQVVEQAEDLGSKFTIEKLEDSINSWSMSRAGGEELTNIASGAAGASNTEESAAIFEILTREYGQMAEVAKSAADAASSAASASAQAIDAATASAESISDLGAAAGL
jgi:hypothetical protein